MDVKTAFLNGHLQEELYVDQLEGFISKADKHKLSNHWTSYKTWMINVCTRRNAIFSEAVAH
ncbi:unnamed protein product [Prunus armeniaca]